MELLPITQIMFQENSNEDYLSKHIDYTFNCEI
jgi:hypothetical protein